MALEKSAFIRIRIEPERRKRYEAAARAYRTPTGAQTTLSSWIRMACDRIAPKVK